MSILKTLLTKTPTAAAASTAKQLWAWGNNTSGELGDNSTTPRSSPVQIGSDASWTVVTAGNSFSASISSNGNLYVWGNNANNLVTTADSTNRSSPLLVNSGSWSAVAAGDSHILALKSDNTLWGYGAGTLGQLGTGSTVFDSTASWNQVAAADDHTNAISATDGSLWAWGSGLGGQLGNSSSASNYSAPVSVSTSSWKSVAAGYSSIVAIKGDGSLWSAGQNFGGNLGQGNTSNNSILTQVGTSSWTVVRTGAGFGSTVMAIRSDGRLFAWGSNTTGQCGQSNTTNYSSPVQVGTSSWTTIAVGLSTVGAIRSDGALFMWGYNASGGAGAIPDGGLAHRSSPVQIGTSSWIAVGIAASNGYAIRSDGRLFAWGFGGQGMLGDNSTSNSYSSPVAVSSTDSWIAVTATGSAVSAIKYVSTSGGVQLGSLWAWGQAFSGLMGNSQSSGTYSSPVQIGSSTSWTRLNNSNAGTSTAAAINASKLYMWGVNSQGQLGQSNLTSTSSPVAVKTTAQLSITQIGTSSWIAIAAGKSFSAAIRTDGGLFTWGTNAVGLNGQSDTVHRSSPVQVGTSSWTALAVTGSHVAAIRSGGSLFTWGDNTVGQLGQSDTVHRSSPVQVGTSSWTTIAAGTSHTLGTIGTTLYGWGGVASGAAGNFGVWSDIKILPSHVLALKTDGSLWSWGANNWGQLGQGDLIYRSSPVQIGTSSWSAIGGFGDGSAAIRSDGRLFQWGGIGIYNIIQGQYDALGSWTGVASAASHTLALRADGGLWAWGTQPNGELGAGNTSQYLSAIQVSTSSWSQIYAAASQSAAIRSDGALFTWGYGLNGQLGQAPSAPATQSSPVKVGSSSWTQVAIGNGGGFAILSSGTLYGWGQSSAWANTMFGSTSNSSPVAVSGGGTWTDISIEKNAGLTAAGIKNNLLFTWGANTTGTLGTSEATTTVRSSPVQIGASSWLKVRVGGNGSATYMLAIKQGGTLWAWGDNTFGQLGDSTTVSKSSPVQIGSNTNWSTIECNASNSMAVDSAGNIYAWGDNSSAQCNDPNFHALQVDYNDANSPTNAAAAAILATSSGASAGPLYVWGYNSFGQLGLSNASNQSIAQQVGSGSWRNVSVGNGHMVGANASGSIFTWGLATSGQLGNNSTTSTSSPVAVGSLAAKSGTNTIAAGNSVTFVIDSTQKLWAWGNGINGLLGDSTTSSKSSPVQIGSSSWLQVSAKYDTVLAIRSDGRLFAWGNNNYGQAGQSSTSPFNYSSPIAIGTSSWIFIAAGISTCSAIRSDNTIWTWGFNSNFGYLLGEGNGTGVHRSSPVQVGSGGSGAGGTWSWVSVGTSNIHAIKSDNSLWVWGAGGIQAGLNTASSYSSPVAVSAGLSNPSVSYIAVASGGSNAVAIMRSSGFTNNQLVIWGNNAANGILANNTASGSQPLARGVMTTGSIRNSPVVVSVTGGRSAANSISVGDGAIFATTTVTGLPMYHAGNTNSGISAINTNQPSQAFFRGYPAVVAAYDPIYVKTPIQYDSTTSWIAVGTQHTQSTIYVIKSDGSMWTWGSNMNGQTGLGYTNPSSVSVPTQLGSSSWTAVSTGFSHTLAIRTDGALFHWGSNNYGQAGQSSTSPFNYSSPIAIGTSSWAAVGIQASATAAAIRSDGSLFVWGNNTMSGGLIPENIGLGFHRSSPVQIGTSSWTQVSIGSSNGFAVRTDGQLFAWGGGTNTGGWASATGYTSPVAIGSGLVVNKIGVGGQSMSGTAALSTTSGSLYTWGDAQYGLMGDGQTITSKSSPVQVGGTEGAKSSPIQIGALAWSAVYAGNDISAGKISSTGLLYTWGSNTDGQLGQNVSPSMRFSPVQIGTSSWTSVSAGVRHVLALK